MCTSALRLVCVCLLFRTSLSCFQCFVDVSDSLRLCWGHIVTENNVRNVDACFKKLDRIFNYHEKVIEAGRVGRGYGEPLKKLLDAEILPLVKEFNEKLNKDTVYEERLQRAADNFIAAASKLPRVSGCFPPCGFQSAGAVYNCVTCQYDSCEFPLDCPVKDINATENSRSQMWCEVPFHLPGDIQVIWRVAEELYEQMDNTLMSNMTVKYETRCWEIVSLASHEALKQEEPAFRQNVTDSETKVTAFQVKTQQVDQFKEVTAGLDRLYSIPSASLQHQGTYQCEIYSGQRSIVRLYFFLTVTPEVLLGHTELQEIFDLSLLPAGRLLPDPGASPCCILLSLPLLLTTCLTALFLLLFLSLGALYWSSKPRQTPHAKHAAGDEDLEF